MYLTVRKSKGHIASRHMSYYHRRTNYLRQVYPIEVSLVKDDQLTLDTSGSSLFKRGCRVEGQPTRENMASCLGHVARLGILTDHSTTHVVVKNNRTIEAALIGRNIARS